MLLAGHDGQGVMVAKASCAITNVDNPEIANKAFTAYMEGILNMNKQRRRGGKELKCKGGKKFKNECRGLSSEAWNF